MRGLVVRSTCRSLPRPAAFIPHRPTGTGLERLAGQGTERPPRLAPPGWCASGNSAAATTDPLKTGLAFLSVSGAPIWTRAAGHAHPPSRLRHRLAFFFRPGASRPGKGFAATGGSRGELGVENVSCLIWCSRPLLTGLECWPAWKVPQWRMRRCN